MENTLESLLKSLGLGEGPAKLYLTALELGQASMQELANKSGIKRTSLYNFTKELLARKLLVTSQKKKRTVYSAIHPNQLIEVEKARLAELQYRLPEFLAVFNRAANKPRVTFYEGVEGIKQVYADTLQEKKPMFEWSDVENIASALGEYYFKTYPEERAKRKIPLKALMVASARAKLIEKKSIRHLREIKYLPDDKLKTAITVYGDKVAIMSLRNDNPFTVVIEDSNIAETLKAIWSQQWQSLR